MYLDVDQKRRIIIYSQKNTQLFIPIYIFQYLSIELNERSNTHNIGRKKRENWFACMHNAKLITWKITDHVLSPFSACWRHVYVIFFAISYRARNENYIMLITISFVTSVLSLTSLRIEPSSRQVYIINSRHRLLISLKLKIYHDGRYRTDIRRELTLWLSYYFFYAFFSSLLIMFLFHIFHLFSFVWFYFIHK